MGVSPGRKKKCGRNNEVTVRRVCTVIKKGNEQDGILTCEDTNDNNEPKTRKISAGNPVIATIIEMLIPVVCPL